jgi:hypothetical protein
VINERALALRDGPILTAVLCSALLMMLIQMPIFAIEHTRWGVYVRWQLIYILRWMGENRFATSVCLLSCVSRLLLKQVGAVSSLLLVVALPFLEFGILSYPHKRLLSFTVFPSIALSYAAAYIQRVALRYNCDEELDHAARIA